MFMLGGKAAVMGEKPPLKPYVFDAGAYDSVVLCYPVWAASPAPPIKTFVTENAEALKNLRVYAAACQSGSGAEKSFEKLSGFMGGAALAGTLVLIDPAKKPSAEKDAAVDAFAEKISEA